MESSCDDASKLYKALSPAFISTRFTLMMQEGGDCDYSMVKTLFEASVPKLSEIEHVDILKALGLKGGDGEKDEAVMEKCIAGLEIAGVVLSLVHGVHVCKADKQVRQMI
jgi:hypothetical protein